MQKFIIMMQNSAGWQRIRNTYEVLETKDRRAVQVLLASVVFAVTYFTIWEPLNRWSYEQKAGYQHQQEVNNWLNSNRQRALEFQKNQRTGIGQRELSSVVGSVARKSGVVLSRVQPDPRGLSVWVEDAAYQKFLAWLVSLENQYRVQVQQIKIDKRKEEGRIKAYLHLAN